MPENIHSIPFAFSLKQEIKRKNAEAEARGERYGVRTLAKRLAEDWVEGATDRTIENERGLLRKYLYRGVVPTDRKKRRIALALGREEDFFFSDMPGFDELVRKNLAVREAQRVTA